MVVTLLGQQYNTGEKPTVILYTYINRHAGTPDKKQKKQKQYSTTSNMVVQVYQVRSLDRPLFIVFAHNSEGIIVTSQTREQGTMEGAVSSSLFSVYAIKKRVH